MNINRENYEMYFLDYYEGQLKSGQVAELLVFIEEHPELKEEFEDYESILITPNLSISYCGKTSLKKDNISDCGPINASNYETYFIGDTEKQLTPEELNWLAGFLKSNPGLESEYELYLNTRLQSDTHIQYPKKSGLKRSIFNTRKFYYFTLTVAASIALLFTVFMNSGTKQGPVLAVQQKSLGITPVPNNKKNQAIPLQNNSDQSFAPITKSASNAVVPDQIPVQALAGNEQHLEDRNSVTKIQARLEARITSRDIVEPKYIFIRQSKNNPETYANLYDQINLAERMQNEQVLAPVVNSPKTMLLAGLRKLGGIFTGKEAPSSRSSVNFWTLANLGINGYNLLTDKDLKLLTQANDSGKVVSFALKGEEFEFTRLQNKPITP